MKEKKIKELRLRPNIATHDLNTKLRQASKFLEKGHRVRFVLRFKGREHKHTEHGNKLFNKILATLTNGKMVTKTGMKGSSMQLMVAPCLK